MSSSGLSLGAYIQREKTQLSGLLYKGIKPRVGSQTCDLTEEVPNYLPKVPHSKTITLGIKASTYEFCGDTHTKSLASTYTVVLLEVYKVEGKISLTPEHHLEVPSLAESLVPS